MPTWLATKTKAKLTGRIFEVATLALGTVEAENHSDARQRATEQFGTDYSGLAVIAVDPPRKRVTLGDVFGKPQSWMN